LDKADQGSTAGPLITACVTQVWYVGLTLHCAVGLGHVWVRVSKRMI